MFDIRRAGRLMRPAASARRKTVMSLLFGVGTLGFAQVCYLQLLHHGSLYMPHSEMSACNLWSRGERHDVWIVLRGRWICTGPTHSADAWRIHTTHPLDHALQHGHGRRHQRLGIWWAPTAALTVEVAIRLVYELALHRDDGLDLRRRARSAAERINGIHHHGPSPGRQLKNRADAAARTVGHEPTSSVFCNTPLVC